jgi:hypothetical protein
MHHHAPPCTTIHHHVPPPCRLRDEIAQFQDGNTQSLAQVSDATRQAQRRCSLLHAATNLLGSGFRGGELGGGDEGGY